MRHNRANSGASRATENLIAGFKKRPVRTLSELMKLLGASRRTIFRALKQVGYQSSYSHAGKYYTLRSIPCFDANGLWFHRDVGFSQHGTLRATLVVMATRAPAGLTHEDLHAILQIKVHNTLGDLVRAGLLGREQHDATYVYVAPNSKAARAQLAERRSMTAVPVKERAIDLAVVVEILLVVIRKQEASVPQLCAILGGKGLALSEHDIAGVLDRYGLKKKAESSPSRRSNA